MEIGEAVRTRFIWDHGGTIVYVCVMQNGIKKSYRLLKENDGYHAANATLWSGRCEFRYIVDNIWTHDKDLPAVRTEQGHYNNQVRIKMGPDGSMLIKNPREANLAKAQGAKKAKADVHDPPAKYEIRKCLSGDETLMLSHAEASSNMNETLVMSQGDQEESDDEVDDEVLSMEEPIPHSIFLTDMMPELEVVEPEKQAKPGLLESHFPISTEISTEKKDKEGNANLRANYPNPPEILCTPPQSETSDTDNHLTTTTADSDTIKQDLIREGSKQNHSETEQIESHEMTVGKEENIGDINQIDNNQSDKVEDAEKKSISCIENGQDNMLEKQSDMKESGMINEAIEETNEVKVKHLPPEENMEIKAIKESFNESANVTLIEAKESQVLKKSEEQGHILMSKKNSRKPKMILNMKVQLSRWKTPRKVFLMTHCSLVKVQTMRLKMG